MKSQRVSFNSSSAAPCLPRFNTGSVLKLALVALLLAGLQPILQASTNWYVRSGTSGSNNGTDWNNAWTNVSTIVWSSVNAGDTIWIAGGSYGVLKPNRSGLSGSPVLIARVRSTNSAPVSAAGWNPVYDATVTINGVQAFSGVNWWTLDGQIPHSGMVITNTDLTGNIITFANVPANNVTLKNLLITGGATNTTMSGIGDTRGIHANFSSSPGTGLTVSDCTFQQVVSHVIILKWNNVVFERCKFWRNFAGNSGNHPNILAAIGCTNVVFRHNECTEWLTEGIMMCFVNTNDAPNDTWEIHNNLWHDSYPGWYGRTLESQSVAQYRIRFYNNTVVNVHFGILAGAGGTWDSSCVSRNNIGMNVLGYGLLEFPGGDNDYNLSDTSNSQVHGIGGATTDIFASYANKDYRIVTTIGTKYPRDQGADLGSPYNVDLLGNIRTVPWDIGAFEFAPGPLEVSPPPPQNLRVAAP